jgi:organic radical activating enzyme
MNTNMKQWKIENLDSKSPSFCGAKWYNASIWLSQAWTTSCHHNPPHPIDLEAIKTNPLALHNTAIKKQERAMMQQGEKPANCQSCWVMEDTNPDGLSDRTWLTWGGHMTSQQLQTAYDSSPDNDYDLTYLELCFDRTCNLGCSYCAPAISSTWAKDIRTKGPYIDLPTDHRRHYISTQDDAIKYDFGDDNPYADAFFKWWDTSLHKTIKQVRISGGEPMMSGHTWKLLDWLADNAGKADCRIEMTTNLAYDYDTLMRFLDKCSKISVPIWLYSSNETTNAKAEYIRDGLNWEAWNANLDVVLSSGVIAKTGLCATMSALAADGFVGFLTWLLKRKKLAHNEKTIDNLMLSVNPLRFPTFQSIVVLPDLLRKQYSQEIQNFLSNPDIVNYFNPIELDHINRFATYLTTVEDPHKESRIAHNAGVFDNTHNVSNINNLRQDFKSFFTQYDHRRGKSLTQTFPQLADWYNNIGTA